LEVRENEIALRTLEGTLIYMQTIS